jgi:hypothetical protein
MRTLDKSAIISSWENLGGTCSAYSGHMSAHFFFTDFVFARAFPMKKENEVHEALSLLFHRDGVPNAKVMDGAKAQVEGEFRRKLRDDGCHIKQTEPHTQPSNMGEDAVRELKR